MAHYSGTYRHSTEKSVNIGYIIPSRTHKPILAISKHPRKHDVKLTI